MSAPAISVSGLREARSPPIPNVPALERLRAVAAAVAHRRTGVVLDLHAQAAEGGLGRPLGGGEGGGHDYAVTLRYTPVVAVPEPTQ